MVVLILKTTDTPLKPKDIDSDEFGISAFKDKELGEEATWVVHFCQSKRSWTPFKLEHLAKYLSGHNICLGDKLSRLEALGLLSMCDKVVTLTTAFVAACYKLAPLQGLPRKKSTRVSKKVPEVSKYTWLHRDPF